MINEIEVTAECNGYDLCVVFRTFSKNDGGQSDEISKPEYFADGGEITNNLNFFGESVVEMLNDMFENYQNYEHTEKEITPQSEWD